VPGYVEPEPDILLDAIDVPLYSTTLPEEYTESLIEWFDARIQLQGGPQ
jgi:hypothetical protein